MRETADAWEPQNVVEFQTEEGAKGFFLHWETLVSFVKTAFFSQDSLKVMKAILKWKGLASSNAGGGTRHSNDMKSTNEDEEAHAEAADLKGQRPFVGRARSAPTPSSPTSTPPSPPAKRIRRESGKPAEISGERRRRKSKLHARGRG